MTVHQCFRILGLREPATSEEIKRAYRQLAQRLHPDKHGGDEGARREFVQVSAAYRVLIRATRAVEKGKPVGLCRKCESFGEVLLNREGSQVCPECALLPGPQRYLPMPEFVVVRCVASTGLLIGAVLLLFSFPGLAALAAFLSIANLAWTCLSVVYCIHPRERQYQKEHVHKQRR